MKYKRGSFSNCGLEKHIFQSTINIIGQRGVNENFRFSEVILSIKRAIYFLNRSMIFSERAMTPDSIQEKRPHNLLCFAIIYYNST